MKKLGVFVVIGFAALTACRTSKESYVAKGNKLFAAGKYAEAELQYRNAIQKNVQYGEAFYRLGLAELKLEKPSDAQRALVRAVQLLPDNIDAKEQLGSLMLQYYMIDPRHSQNYYNVVKQISDELLAKDPNSFEGTREKAYLTLSDAKTAEAIALFRKAHDLKPSDGTVALALAQNMIRSGQSKAAEQLALDLISKQKTYPSMYDLLYELYLTQGRQAEAENILKTKIANNPNNAGDVLQLADYYFIVHKQAEMKATLQRLVDNPKEFPEARFQIGDFYVKLKSYPEAVQSYEQGARSAKGALRIEYLKRAENALVADGRREEASQVVEQILRDDPKNEEARRIQAGLLLVSGKSNNIATAEHEFQDLSKDNANDAAVWLGIARAEELKGDLNAARLHYLEAVNKRKNYLPARYALAEIGLIQERPDQTLQQSEEILKINPSDPRARLLHAQALVRTGSSAVARVELTNLVKDAPKDVQAQLELGLLSLSERKYAEATSIFDKLRATGDPRAYAGLARSYTSQRQFEKALEILRDGQKKTGGATLLVSEIGTTAALAGQFDLAISQFREVTESQPRSVSARLSLGDAYELKGDETNAVAAYREAFNLAPQDLTAGLDLAKALIAAGLMNQAKGHLQTLLQSHPDDPLVMNQMAYFLSQNGGDLDEALRLAQRALEKIPGQPSFSDTIGCIYLKKGLKSSAMQVFSNLVQKYPKYPTFRYHLAMVLLENGEKARARRELDTALGDHPSREDSAQIKALLGKIS